MNLAVAFLKNARISPKKLLLAAKLVSRMSVLKAKAQLQHQPQKSCSILLGVLNSAIANATQKNKEVNLEDVFINIVDVGPGATRRKGNPRAKGRYDTIVKRFSNVRVVLKIKEKDGK
jgi:large subunit ribosomal protein L22